MHFATKRRSGPVDSRCRDGSRRRATAHERHQHQHQRQRASTTIVSTTSTGLGSAGQAARTTGGSRPRVRREGGSEAEWAVAANAEWDGRRDM
jgi:hypothetical protein